MGFLSAILSGPWSIVARIVGALAIVGAVWGHGFVKGMEHDEARRDKADANSRNFNVVVVEKYHEKIKYVYRNAHNILPNLERLCRNGKLRDASGIAGAAKTKDDHGATVEGLADEIQDCLTENAQLNSALDALDKQVKKP